MFASQTTHSSKSHGEDGASKYDRASELNPDNAPIAIMRMFTECDERRQHNESEEAAVQAASRKQGCELDSCKGDGHVLRRKSDGSHHDIKGRLNADIYDSLHKVQTDGHIDS
jgi:hypothetical protein